MLTYFHGMVLCHLLECSLLVTATQNPSQVVQVARFCLHLQW